MKYGFFLTALIASGLALQVNASGADPSGAEKTQTRERARARDLGIAPGVMKPGPLNAITDVAGVRVGHVTLMEDDDVRTGITAIFPHGENPFISPVPASIHVANGYGKLLGSTQVLELGEIETPILLTCTLCVWKAADALVDWMLELPGMHDVGSINPVVGETNDGYLNAIRSRPISAVHVRKALSAATGGPVLEGSVGAGTGTIAFDWKGGIGTSSREVPGDGWTVGVLVQSNFGGDLRILGVPVGRELGRTGIVDGGGHKSADGSIMIVVATNAPLSDRNLKRVAARAILGLGRTGASGSNGSGDYVIAFSNHPGVRRQRGATETNGSELSNDRMSGLFRATIEATEEAIYNSMFMATTVEGSGNRVEALPLDEVRRILHAHRVGN